ncbi:MAG TPA: FIST N-terminal domain-containing protein [Acidimicrobiales bacterium]|jgi:small ligand-binding sensory domain FIST|nr:FIST N-terminal domain-containing protein [Acidimicrobiales bacterium]
MTGFAAALSEHPDLGQATAEVVGQVLERLPPGGPPDLAVLFASRAHLGGFAEAAEAVRSALGPATLVGCAAESVVGGAREVERAPGLSLWAGSTGPVAPFHLTATMTPDGPVLAGWPEVGPDVSGMIVLADPFSFPADLFLRQVGSQHPGLPVVGGMALAGQGPGQNQLVLDDQVFTAGAVGVLLGAGVRVTTVVSQGCRPVGNPLVVTRAEGNVVFELAGRPPLERLGEVAETMPEEERAMLYRGVHLGIVIDEHKTDFGRGDFLVRNVLGGDPQSGAIQVGDVVEVGATTQFQVRDALSADEDLRQLLAGCQADAALLFTCNGRGVNLFGKDNPDHDATVVSEGLGGAPVAGMFCAGELGPVGGRPFLHGFTASLALLSHPPD